MLLCITHTNTPSYPGFCLRVRLTPKVSLFYVKICSVSRNLSVKYKLRRVKRLMKEIMVNDFMGKDIFKPVGSFAQLFEPLERIELPSYPDLVR